MYVSAHQLNYCCINGQYVVRPRAAAHVRPLQCDARQKRRWRARRACVVVYAPLGMVRSIWSPPMGQHAFRSVFVIYGECCIYGDAERGGGGVEVGGGKEARVCTQLCTIACDCRW